MLSIVTIFHIYISLPVNISLSDGRQSSYAKQDSMRPVRNLIEYLYRLRLLE